MHTSIRARRLLALATATLLGTTLAITATATSASAAVITDAVTDVTYSPDSPVVGGRLDMEMSFCLPNGSKAGDQFYLDLDPRLTDLPRSLPINSPEGERVALATAAPVPPATSGPPYRLTFTLTDYVEKNQDVCGAARLNLQLSRNLTEGETITLVASDGDEDFTQDITPTGRPGTIDGTLPVKTARWTSEDQGHTDADGAIEYAFRSPTGPITRWTVVDTEPPTGVTFDCSSVVVEVGRLAGDTNSRFVSEGTYTGSVDTACSATTLRSAMGAVPAGKVVQLRLLADLVVPTGEGTQFSFTNRATFAVTSEDGTTTRTRDSASVSQFGGGGEAGGTVPTPSIEIIKDDVDGNAADTADDAVDLTASSGATGLVFTITNDGTEGLSDVEVGDEVVAGGSVTGLTCDFSELGGPATGTAWDGPFLVGDSFTCTANLADVVAGTPHEDVASVTGTGVFSGTPVDDENAYHAVVTPPTTTTTTPSPTETVGGDSGTATPTASTTVDAASGGEELAYTGAPVMAWMWIAGVLLLLGAALRFGAARTAPSRRH